MPSVFELIKLRVLRRLLVPVIRLKWRGKLPAGVVAEPLGMASGETWVAARRYTPVGEHRALPVMLFFHGGGWVGFNLDTHDALCRDLCRRTGHMVISVDYRLAPEHPFPAGVQDCLGALDWLVGHAARIGADPQRICLVGDSAGGNLAAVLALQARSRHPGMIKGQVLVYPVTDHASGDWPSHARYGRKPYPLTRESLADLWRWYTAGSREWPASNSHDLATPYRVADLSGLPPALVVLAEEDLLHDEGQAYARRMQEAGAEVQLKTYAGQKHGFVGLEPTPAHEQALADIQAWMSRLYR